MQVLFNGIDKAYSVVPEYIAAALSGIEADTIIGKVSVRVEDHQFVRGNYFGQVQEQNGVLRPVISTTIGADKAMPAADPACQL